MSTASQKDYSYQVGGSLKQNDPTYVVRQADHDFYQGLKAGEFCYVLNSRQMGKSSLRVRTMRRLQAEGIACGVIDITSIGSHKATPSEWYLGVVRRLKQSLGLKVKVIPWWNEREGLSPLQRLAEFIDQVLLTQISDSIVIFIDEIDSILRLKFKDDFFALIRACCNERAEKPEYQRLTFALLGVATPSDLIQDKNRTPFNIGQAIQLEGFRLSEVQPLSQGLVGRVENPQGVMEEILWWTGGQPFLTQKLCQLVLNACSDSSQCLNLGLIEGLVRTYVIENWESQDEPEHLRTIRDRLLRNEQRVGCLLGLYQQILHQGELNTDKSFDHMELRLSGLVVEQEGKLKVYNPIYAAVFNQAWLEQALAQLRPYGKLLKLWLASDCRDESRLLRGKALQDAQAWVAGKSLSTVDYQFLAASQELDKRDVQKRLEAEEKAKQVLEDANHKASQRLFISMWFLGLIIIIGTVASILVVKWNEKQLQLTEDSTLLERKGMKILRQVELETKPVETLMEAIIKVNKLQVLKKDYYPQRRLPVSSPILALQTILDPMWQPKVLRSNQKGLTSISFSPDGEYIVTNAVDKIAELWDISRQKMTPLRHQGIVTSVSFSSNDQRLITATDDQIKVWNFLGEEIDNLDYPDRFSGATLSPDGQYIIVIANPPQNPNANSEPTQKEESDRINGIVEVWNLSGQKIARLEHENSVSHISFSPDGQYIIAIANPPQNPNANSKPTQKKESDRINGIVEVWKLSGQKIARLEHENSVSHVSFSPDGQQIATVSGNTANLWNIPEETIQFPIDENSVSHVSFSPDGQHIVTVSDNTAKIWDISGKQISILKGHQDTIKSANFSKDGQRIVTTSYDKTARVWNLSGKEIAILRHKEIVNNARFASNNREIITTSSDGIVILWSEPLTFPGNQSFFSLDGKHILTVTFEDSHQSDDNNKATVWDLSRQKIAQLEGEYGIVNRAIFSNDGQHIVMAFNDKTAKVWNSSGKEIATLEGHRGIVNTANFSKDNKILTTSLDNTARVWNKSGHEIAIWRDVNSATFSPNGKYVLTTSSDNIAQIRKVENPKELLDRGCEWLRGYQSYETNVNVNQPVTVSQIEQKALEICDLPSEVSRPVQVSPEGVVVVIDPAHGLSPDTGTIGIGGLREDDVSLSISQKVAAILKHKGVFVVLTRNRDNHVDVSSVSDSYQYRINQAKQANATLFISIHANAFNGTAKGLETYYFGDNELLAQVVHNTMLQNIGGVFDRGIKDGSHLYILRQNSMPAILIETGFIDNQEDFTRLINPQYQNQMADAIAKGILLYLHKNSF
ncbi:N-acetylmuramoyl-L-alanine amidase [Coleofasciculus sp.]|uniref:N-acetylmuramoyl-L-alanine amidase n=1 Tax=Coleofasciculus sp. TaxID=3100458 RepID=UPI0039F9D644